MRLSWSSEDFQVRDKQGGARPEWTKLSWSARGVIEVTDRQGAPSGTMNLMRAALIPALWETVRDRQQS